jgi:hypothetical protein
MSMSLEAGRFELSFQQGPHRSAVQLEHTERVTPGEQVGGLLVGVEVEVRSIYVTPVFFLIICSVFDHREVSKPKKKSILMSLERLQRRLSSVELVMIALGRLALHDRKHVDERLRRQGSRLRGVHPHWRLRLGYCAVSEYRCGIPVRLLSTRTEVAASFQRGASLCRAPPR